MANETQIVNMALLLIGEVTISDFGDEDTKEGRLVNRFYEQIRDEVLADSRVNFKIATARSGPLALVSNEPSFGWDHAYQLPNGTLRIIGLITETEDKDQPLRADWVREGDLILTNEDAVYIKYIKQVTDATRFPPHLVKAIYTKLAAEIAFAITADSKMEEKLLTKYELVVFPDAISANAAEGFILDELGHDSIAEAGRF